MEKVYTLNESPRSFGFFIVLDSCAPQSSRKAFKQGSRHFFCLPYIKEVAMRMKITCACGRVLLAHTTRPERYCIGCGLVHATRPMFDASGWPMGPARVTREYGTPRAAIR